MPLVDISSVQQLQEEECKAVQSERGSSVCTWDPSRGSWAQYATGEHVYRDEGECIVPCNPRPDRLSCEFAGDQNCAWDDCKRECVEVPERVAELNLAGKEGYMKETNCNGRGVDATWFYGAVVSHLRHLHCLISTALLFRPRGRGRDSARPLQFALAAPLLLPLCTRRTAPTVPLCSLCTDFACTGEHSHCYVEDKKTNSFQRPFADQRRFLNYGDQCFETPCTDDTCSTFWGPSCEWNDKWSHPESDECDWSEDLDCGMPQCRPDCLALNKLMLDPTYKDTEPKFPTNVAKAEHFCRLEAGYGCSWNEDDKKCEWGLREGCSISWPRHIAKHFTQAQLRGLNDGRDADGGMGNHWDKVESSRDPSTHCVPTTVCQQKLPELCCALLLLTSTPLPPHNTMMVSAASVHPVESGRRRWCRPARPMRPCRGAARNSLFPGLLRSALLRSALLCSALLRYAQLRSALPLLNRRLCSESSLKAPLRVRVACCPCCLGRWLPQVITMKGRFPRSRCFEKCELRATERHCLSPGEGGRIGNMDENFARTLEYVSPSGVKTPCDSFPAMIDTASGEVVGADDPSGTWQMPMECISMCRWNYEDEKCYTSCEMRGNEEMCVKGGCDWDATPGALFGPGKVAQFGAIPYGTQPSHFKCIPARSPFRPTIHVAHCALTRLPPRNRHSASAPRAYPQGYHAPGSGSLMASQPAHSMMGSKAGAPSRACVIISRLSKERKRRHLGTAGQISLAAPTLMAPSAIASSNRICAGSTSKGRRRKSWRSPPPLVQRRAMTR